MPGAGIVPPASPLKWLVPGDGVVDEHEEHFMFFFALQKPLYSIPATTHESKSNKKDLLVEDHFLAFGARGGNLSPSLTLRRTLCGGRWGATHLLPDSYLVGAATASIPSTSFKKHKTPFLRTRFIYFLVPGAGIEPALYC